MAILILSRRGTWLRCTLVLLCVTAPRWRAHAQATPSDLEYRVKAAYLLNFARYAEWPPAAFAGGDTALNVCVVGRDPFGPVLDETLRGRRLSGRPLRVVRRARPTGVSCHLAFLGAETRPVLESWLAALATEPTLTVGEGDGFAGAGGMIGFVIVDETVRFEINTEAVLAGGLRLSSRLLSLAARLLPERHP